MHHSLVVVHCCAPTLWLFTTAHLTPLPGRSPPHSCSLLPPPRKPQMEALTALQSPSSLCNRHMCCHHSQRAEPSGKQRRNSCLASPSRNQFRQPSNTPQTHTQATSPPKIRHRRSKSNPVKSTCPMCLSCHPHFIHKCNETMLWDGTPTYACCNSEGCLINKGGAILCSDWQKPNGCNLPHKSAQHECSGCGDAKHGTQKCLRA